MLGKSFWLPAQEKGKREKRRPNHSFVLTRSRLFSSSSSSLSSLLCPIDSIPSFLPFLSPFFPCAEMGCWAVSFFLSCTLVSSPLAFATKFQSPNDSIRDEMGRRRRRRRLRISYTPAKGGPPSSRVGRSSQVPHPSVFGRGRRTFFEIGQLILSRAVISRGSSATIEPTSLVQFQIRTPFRSKQLVWRLRLQIYKCRVG